MSIFHYCIIVSYARGHLHDETRSQHCLLKPGFTVSKSFSVVFVIGKRGCARLSSNTAHKNERSHFGTNAGVFNN